MNVNVTNRVRTILIALFVLTGVAAVVGWFLDLDPSALVGILGAEAAAIGFGEASNAAKRATWKPGA